MRHGRSQSGLGQAIRRRPARLADERRALTALLTVAAAGSFALFALASAIDGQPALLPGDGRAFSIGRALHLAPIERIVAVLTDLGSLPVTAAVTLAAGVWAVRRRRAIEGIALVVALALTFVTVHVAKRVEGRARPSAAYVTTSNASYPSGHAAYSVAFVACAVVLMRSGRSLAARSAVITAAVALAVFVASSRIYLRAHYLSDVVGGLGLGAAVFSLCLFAALVVSSVRHNGAQ